MDTNWNYWKILENKAKITNKEIERALDNMALLEQRQEEFCLRLRTVQEELGEDVREKAVESLSNFLNGRYVIRSE